MIFNDIDYFNNHISATGLWTRNVATSNKSICDKNSCQEVNDTLGKIELQSVWMVYARKVHAFNSSVVKVYFHFSVGSACVYGV